MHSKCLGGMRSGMDDNADSWIKQVAIAFEICMQRHNADL